ncbi:MAG: HlyD family type I secretion periplasmic adaptor subunit [Pseudomonadota bacterium]
MTLNRSGARNLAAPTAISADLLKPVPLIWNGLVIGLCAAVFASVAWASLATVEEATRGEGRVVPASKIQVVQNLEGGIVRELNVKEGDRVATGDILLRIDPTRATASHGEATERIAGLQIKMARLEAEVAEKELTFSPALVQSQPELIAREFEHDRARRTELASAISALQLQERQRAQELVELDAKVATLARGLAIARAQLALIEPLVKRRAASRSDLLSAQEKVNDTEGGLEAARLAIPRVRAQKAEVARRIEERKATYRAQALAELTKTRVDLAALRQANQDAADTLQRTTVRAPTNGIIKTVYVTTRGQVVKPGSDLVEIVPLDETLLIEARVAPQDIAFLRPGQPALVKLTAYDFSIYGGLDGSLVHIGADSITDDQGQTYYLIRVRTKSSRLRHGDDNLPVIPGMVAQVDVLTGSKTVLSYLTKPLTRMRQDALRER